MGEFQIYECDYKIERLLTHSDWCRDLCDLRRTERRNRHDPFAILTIPTKILHDPPKIPRIDLAVPVTFVSP